MPASSSFWVSRRPPEQAAAGITISDVPAATWSVASPSQAVKEDMIAVSATASWASPAHVVEERIAAVVAAASWLSPAHAVLEGMAAAAPTMSWTAQAQKTNTQVTYVLPTMNFQSSAHAVQEGMAAVAAAFSWQAGADAAQVSVAAATPTMSWTAPADAVLLSIADVPATYVWNAPAPTLGGDVAISPPSATWSFSAPAATVDERMAAVAATFSYQSTAAKTNTQVLQIVASFSFLGRAASAQINPSPPAASWTVTPNAPATRTDVQTTPGAITWVAPPPATTTSGGGVSTTPFTGYVYGTPASGTVSQGGSGFVTVRLKGEARVGDTGQPSWAFPATRVCTLGYSNQTSPTDIPTLEASIGRSFTGLRQNQQYTVTSVSTAITEYDAGRTLSYRSIQFNTAPGGWAAAAAGTFDTQLVAFCNAVIAAGRWTAQNPFWVCLHHEATTSGGVFGTPGFSAADHKAMWQHCVPVMLATGAPIAFAYIGWDRMFVGLNGIGPPTAGQSFDDLDPGSAYYSRIGSDPYNQPDSPGVLRYGTSAATLLEPIRQAAIARGMDWMMGEMGCQDGSTQADHDNKAAWLDSLRVYVDGLGAVGPGVCRAVLTTQETPSLYNWDSSVEALAAGARFGHDVYYK